MASPELGAINLIAQTNKISYAHTRACKKKIYIYINETVFGINLFRRILWHRIIASMENVKYTLD